MEDGDVGRTVAQTRLTVVRGIEHIIRFGLAVGTLGGGARDFGGGARDSSDLGLSIAWRGSNGLSASLASSGGGVTRAIPSSFLKGLCGGPSGGLARDRSSGGVLLLEVNALAHGTAADEVAAEWNRRQEENNRDGKEPQPLLAGMAKAAVEMLLKGAAVDMAAY